MSADKTIDILKEAILLERRGQAFYQKVAGQAVNPDVKAFFETMAEEEVHHVDILERQFTAYIQDQQFLPLDLAPGGTQTASQKIFSPELKQQIAAADFEAAAISAAMLMEERAIALYSQSAEAAKDPAEKELYRWLADWEKQHLSFLAKWDKEVRETIWQNNQFWPY